MLALSVIALFQVSATGMSERDVYPSTRQDGTLRVESLSPRSEIPASSAPGGAGTPSGNSGAQATDGRVAGADYTEGGDAHADSRVSADERSESTGRVTRRACTARRGLAFYRSRLAYWAHKMGAPRTKASSRSFAQKQLACPRYLAALWRRQARAARREYERWFERTYEKYACIHRLEGAWYDADPPHYGGLQFDDSFQRTYGPEFFRRWGHAGKWPVWAQLVAAERAYRTRGFGPWPNTARACGLL